LRRKQITVERVVPGGEADVCNGIRLGANVARAAELARLRSTLGRGAFAVDPPRAAAKDAFGIGLHPRRHAFEKPDLVIVYRAIAPDRNAEHEVTVLAHDVDQHIHDLTDSLVLVLLGDGAAVMPRADAGVGLPRVRADAGRDAPLDVLHDAGDVVRLHVFGVDNGLELALVAREVGVVVVRYNVKPGLAQREFGVVEVVPVGVILINQVLAAEKPLLRKRRIHRRRVLAPHAVVFIVPLVHRFDPGDTGGNNHVASGVEFLRVEALPPLALAVSRSQLCGVVAHAGERALSIVPVSHLKPVPRVSRVVAHAEAQAARTRDFGPGSNDVLFRADVDRVPGVILRVVGVEVVVVVGKGEKVFRARALVKGHQLLRLPALRLPQVVNLHEAELGWMTKSLYMVVINTVALYVHLPRVPVALFRDALGRRVRPDAELCVAEPFGEAVVLHERFPGRLEWPAGKSAGRLSRSHSTSSPSW